MPVRNRQWYLNILARYHAKVNHPTYGDIRKRGNPQSVLKAVMILRGSKACKVCRSLDHVELHHVDGNWKNYTLNNLWYFCHECHNQTHTEMKTMTTPRTRSIWTDDRIKALRADVNALVAKGSTKAAAFNKLAPKYKCSHYHISRMYRYDHATIRQWARSKSTNNTARTSVARSTVNSTAVTMTPAEAIQFYNFLKNANITIA